MFLVLHPSHNSLIILLNGIAGVFWLVKCVTLDNWQFLQATFWDFTKGYAIVRAFRLLACPTLVFTITLLRHNPLNGLFTAQFPIIFTFGGLIVIILIIGDLIILIRIWSLFIFQSQKSLNRRSFTILHFLLPLFLVKWGVFPVVAGLLVHLILTIWTVVLSQNNLLFNSTIILKLFFESFWIQRRSCKAHNLFTVWAILPTEVMDASMRIRALFSILFLYLAIQGLSLAFVLDLTLQKCNPLFFKFALLAKQFFSCNCSSQAFATKFEDFEAVRNDIWETSQTFILFLILIRHSSFNWSLGTIVLFLFLAWTFQSLFF